MKKFLSLMALFVLGFVLVGCESDDNGNGNGDTNGRPADAKIQLLQFPHLDGYGNEVMRDMPILFEFEMRDFVKYQVAFVSCTCRAPRVNYWSVAYIEVSKQTGEILTFSFGPDGDDGNYTAGMWGDSDPIPGTGKTLQDFNDMFFPWLIGKTLADLDGINIFYDEAPSQYADHANTTPINEPELIDAFAGSSVSTHTFIRVAKTLLEHHQSTYMD